MKNVCDSKDSIKKMMTGHREKIFVNYTPDKGFICRL